MVALCVGRGWQQAHKSGYPATMTIPPRLVLFARYPTPGRAKTRLIPALGSEGAAALHRRLTERTLATLTNTGLPVELRSTGAPTVAFHRWLGDVSVVPQGRGHLGQRMGRAATPPAILVGADIPGLTADHIRQAAALLAEHPVVLGPALDGGYYLIGVSAPAPWLFAPMAWGTDTVFGTTLQRCSARGVIPGVLPALADLDRPDDLGEWSGL